MPDLPPIKRKLVPEMLGEFLRAAAVLLLVFGFLDPFLRTGAVTVGYGLALVSLAGFFLMTGIVFELARKE